MSPRLRAAIIICYAIAGLSFALSFLLVEVNQSLMMAVVIAGFVFSMAATMLMTQRRRSGEHVDFTIVPNWRKFLIVMAIMLGPVACGIGIVFGVLAFRDGFVLFGISMFALAIVVGYLMYRFRDTFERVLPR